MDATWRERFIGWRNRRLADPGFQRAMAANPLTRLVARRRARGLFDLVAGFVYSQTLAACVRSGLLDLLARGPTSGSAVAAATRLPPEPAARLLGAAAALSIVEPVGPDRWALGRRGAELMGSPGLADMVAHHALLYADLADPLALLARGRGSLAGHWDYGSGSGGEAAYSRLMTATQPMIAAEVLRACPLRRLRRLLDVGGGEGAFAIAAVRRTPGLRATVFDLPVVADLARARIERAGLADRISVAEGDFRRDPLPGGADAVSLVRVLHDHDDSVAAGLLHAARAALAPGGRLIVAEPMAGTRGAEPTGAAYFGWYLAAMGSGRPRTIGEIAAMMRDAGYRHTRERRTAMPMLCRVIVGTA